MAFRLLRLSSNVRGISQRFKSSLAIDLKAVVENEPPTEVSLLDNGVKVASLDSNSPIATVGILIDAGTRYEDSQNNGAANLLQRLVYKGTAKQTQAELEKQVESLGARLYTQNTREQTALYATCLSKDAPKLVEILSEAVQTPKLNDADIEKARADILNEIESESCLKTVTFDNLHTTAYQNTPLAQYPTGTTKSLKSLTRNDLQCYIDTHYKACRVVLAAAGGVDHKDIVSVGEKTLGKLDNTFDGNIPILAKCRFVGSEYRYRNDEIPKAHIAIAVEGSAANSHDNIALQVASVAIGNWDYSDNAGIHHSSHLARKSAEEGLCYNFETFNIAYSDTSLWGTYYVCDPMKCDDMASTVFNEWVRLCSIVTDGEVERAKNLLKTQLLHQAEGTNTLCQDIGHQVLTSGRRVPIYELIGKIDNVDTNVLRNVCSKYIYNQCMAVSAVGPVENLSDYVNLRTQTYWAVL